MEINRPDRYWVHKAVKWQTKEDNSFYHTKAWRQLRKVWITSNPLCAECLDKGITKAARIVDHVIPIRLGGERLSQSNLQSLCTSCHNSKSSKERNG